MARGTWQVISPRPLRVKTMRNMFETMMRGMGKDIEGDFKKTVETWNHQPDFGPSPPPVQTIGHILRVEVSTDDDQYSLVNAGAPRHPIFPVNAEALIYRKDFKPKTSPGKIRSVLGGKSGEFVYRTEVDHPGFKARKFDETIQQKQEKRFEDKLKKLMPRVAQASGHIL